MYLNQGVSYRPIPAILDVVIIFLFGWEIFWGVRGAQWPNFWVVQQHFWLSLAPRPPLLLSHA